MRAATRKILRKIWYGGWMTMAVGLILLALLFSVFRLILPLATDYKNDIQSVASRLLNHPVTIERIETDWHWFNPRLKLVRLKVLNPDSTDETFAAEEVVLGINLLTSLWGRHLDIGSVTVVGTNFSLHRDKNGDIQVQGVVLPLSGNGRGSAGENPPPFLLNRTLRLVDSKIGFSDEMTGLDFQLQAVNVTVRHAIKTNRAYISVLLPEEFGESLEAGLELQGNLKDIKNIEGKIYLQAVGLKVPAVLGNTPYRDNVQSGQLDFAIWVTLGSGSHKEIQGNLNVQDFSGRFPSVSIQLEKLGADFQSVLKDENIEIHLENLLLGMEGSEWPAGGLSLKTTVQGPEAFRRGELGVDFARLQDLLPVAVQFPQIKTLLDKSDITGFDGDILQLYAKWNLPAEGRPEIDLVSRFESLGVRGSNKVPTVSGLQGDVRLHNQTIKFDFETDSAGFDYAKLFRGALTLNKLHGPVFIDHSSDTVRVSARDLQVQTPHISSRHWFDIVVKGGQSPYVDAYAVYEDGDVGAAKQYYPAGAMTEKMLSWLDAGIIDGKIVQGDFELKGPLDRFPFRGGEGIFRIECDLEGMEINYFNDWTHLKNGNMHARLWGPTLAVALHEGSVYDMKIIGADAWITDFKQANLIVQAPIHGSLTDSGRYLRETGLRDKIGPFVDQVELTGLQTSFVRLEVPLYKDEQGAVAQWRLETSVLNAALEMPRLGLKFSGITADFRLDNDSMVLTPVVADLNDYPVAVGIETRAGEDGNTAFIQVAGNVPPADFLQKEKFDISGFFKGSSHMHAEVSVPLTKLNDADRRTNIILRSDLVGTEIALPEPFRKNADIAAELFLNMQFMPDASLLLDMNYDDWFKSKLLFQSENGRIKLDGADMRVAAGIPTIPSAPGIFIRGKVSGINMDEWLDISVSTESADSNPWQHIELRVGHLTYLQRTVANALFQMQQEPMGWKVTVRSDVATGSVWIPKTGVPRRELIFEIDYLDFDRLSRSFSGAARQVLPTDMPPFRMLAETLVLNDWILHSVELVTEVENNGLSIENLRVGDPDIGLQGSGEWTVDRKGNHHTAIDVTFNSQNVGRGLNKFGYAQLIQDGTGMAQFDLAWAGPPSAFDPKLLQGEASLYLKDGQLLDVKPGGGRLFGLLSVQTIPRRLAFDFKDIFAKGFRFDKMKGDFDFSDGNAYTADYYVDGPVGRIDIEGRVGISQRDYDQTIVFRPDLSSSLPIIGTLLGGTGTGLALIAADRIARLFGKQADDLGRLEYTLTGSWEDPVITPVKAGRTKARDKGGRDNQDNEAVQSVPANPE